MRNLQNLQKKFETDYAGHFKPFNNVNNLNSNTNKNIITFKNVINNQKNNYFLQNSNNNFKPENLFKGRSYTFDMNKKLLNKNVNLYNNNQNLEMNMKSNPIKINLENKDVKIKIINKESQNNIIINNNINNNKNNFINTCQPVVVSQQTNILPRISLSNFHKNDSKKSLKLLCFNKTSSTKAFQNLAFNSCLTGFKIINHNFRNDNTPNNVKKLNTIKLLENNNKFDKTSNFKIDLNKLTNNNDDNITLNRTNPMFFKNKQKLKISKEKQIDYNEEDYKNNNENEDNVRITGENKSENSDKEVDPRINFEHINRINRSRPQTSYGGLNARKKNLQNALQGKSNKSNKNKTNTMFLPYNL